MDRTAPSPLIHVGYYKCASSWLQRFFFLPENGHQLLLDAFTLQRELINPGVDDFDKEAFLQLLQEPLLSARQNGRAPVITSETLCGDLLRGQRNIERSAGRLHTLFGQARILVIVREQGQLLRSMYKTMVLMGMNRSLASLLAETEPGQDQGFTLDFVRFHHLVELYSSMFGAERVLVLPYELFHSDPRTFLDTIQQHCGLPPLEEDQFQQLPTSQVLNPNEPLIYLHGQRWLNQLAMSNRNDYAGPLNLNHKRVWRRMAWHKRRSQQTVFDDYLERRFSARVAQLTGGRFAASNQRLQEFCRFDLSALGYEMGTTRG